MVLAQRSIWASIAHFFPWFTTLLGDHWNAGTKVLNLAHKIKSGTNNLPWQDIERYLRQRFDIT